MQAMQAYFIFNGRLVACRTASVSEHEGLPPKAIAPVLAGRVGEGS